MMLGEITEDGISTHALTWSATSLVPSNVPDTRDFNSRTHVECDAQTRCAKYWVLQFQLTHSRGVRR